MIVGVADKTEELSVNPFMFLLGKSVKGSIIGGTTCTLINRIKQFVNKLGRQFFFLVKA